MKPRTRAESGGGVVTRLHSAIAIAVAMIGVFSRSGRAQGDSAVRATHGTPYRTVVRGRQPKRLADPVGFGTIVDLSSAPLGSRFVDILSGMPGVRVRDGGFGGPQRLTLRGSEAHQVAVLLDGVRLSPAGGGAVDLSLIDPTMFESLELYRSSGSARFGADALGGAVVIRSMSLRQRTAVNFGIGYGSWNSTSARASVRSSWGRLRYAVVGSYRQSDGNFAFVDDNGVRRVRDNNDGDSFNVLLKVDYLAGVWRFAVTEHASAALRGAPGMAQRPSVTARQRDLRNTFALQMTRLGAFRPSGRIVTTVYHRYGHFNFQEPAAPSVFSKNDRFSLGAKTVLHLPLPSRARIDAGVEGRGEFFFDQDVGNRQRVFGSAYAAALLALNGRMLAVSPALRVLAASDYGADILPRIGMVFRPLPRITGLSNLALVANAGRNVRYPTFQERFIRLDGFGGNEQLLPEDALAVDGGVRWTFRGVRVEGAYYRRWIKNTILFAPVSSFLVRPDNYRDVVVDGVETSVSTSSVAGFSVRGSYTFTRTVFGRSTIDNSRRQLPAHPPHRIGLRLMWSGVQSRENSNSVRSALPIWLRDLSVWTDVVYQNRMALDRFNQLSEEGRLLLAIGARYAYKWLVVTAEGKNLLDKRDAVDAVGFPLAPARFFLSTGIRL